MRNYIETPPNQVLLHPANKCINNLILRRGKFGRSCKTKKRTAIWRLQFKAHDIKEKQQNSVQRQEEQEDKTIKTSSKKNKRSKSYTTTM